MYLTLSIGVHVDVDTCCKSIAGLSFFADHEAFVVDDCCKQASETPACCTSEEPSAHNTGCPSDSVYIQVLQDSPPVLAYLEIVPLPSDSEAKRTLLPSPSPAVIRVDEDRCDSPPPLSQEEDLYLVQGSYLTYG